MHFKRPHMAGNLNVFRTFPREQYQSHEVNLRDIFYLFIYFCFVSRVMPNLQIVRIE